MIDIFRTKDVTAVDRNFGESLIQHDPNLADGLAGMKARAGEIASLPAADITFFHTLVDGDLVVLHSRYEGPNNAPGPLLAFDLFRFEDDKIAKHWEVLSPIPPRDQWKNSNGPFSFEILRPPR
jgi:predicted SnoaL-like aldol condensation-catalyzing enzyme